MRATAVAVSVHARAEFCSRRTWWWTPGSDLVVDPLEMTGGEPLDVRMADVAIVGSRLLRGENERHYVLPLRVLLVCDPVSL